MESSSGRYWYRKSQIIASWFLVLLGSGQRMGSVYFPILVACNLSHSAPQFVSAVKSNARSSLLIYKGPDVTAIHKSRSTMSHSIFHNHRLSDVVFVGDLIEKPNESFEALPRLSLSGAFQPNGILSIDNCGFKQYTGYSNMYQANVVFACQTPPLPVVAKAFRVIPHNQASNELFSEVVHTLQEHWSIVGHGHECISPTWPATVTSAGLTIPAIATPYYRNGNILEYVRRHKSRGADRLNLLCQAASALAYVHSKGVVHGNVCPNNFCITNNRTVRMIDICVDTCIRQMDNRNALSIPSKWMYKSGEELEHGIRTTQTDTYSFAATIYSIYTLKTPFPSNGHSYGKSIMRIIDQGHRRIFMSSKPAGMSDELWELIQMCWAIEPSERPTMSEVEGKLGEITELD